MISLRSAFRHMKLSLFKFGGKINFVSSIAPMKLDSEKVAPEIKAVFDYLAENTGKTRQEVIEALRGDSSVDESDAKVATELTWLVEKGHIVEYFNGMIGLPNQKLKAKLKMMLRWNHFVIILKTLKKLRLKFAKLESSQVKRKKR